MVIPQKGEILQTLEIGNKRVMRYSFVISASETTIDTYFVGITQGKNSYPDPNVPIERFKVLKIDNSLLRVSLVHLPNRVFETTIIGQNQLPPEFSRTVEWLMSK